MIWSLIEICKVVRTLEVNHANHHGRGPCPLVVNFLHSYAPKVCNKITSLFRNLNQSSIHKQWFTNFHTNCENTSKTKLINPIDIFWNLLRTPKPNYNTYIARTHSATKHLPQAICQTTMKWGSTFYLKNCTLQKQLSPFGFFFFG